MNDVICTTCGYRGPMRAYGCTQVGLTIFLACFMLLPGILYAFYVDSWRKRCPTCDNRSLIPSASARGQQIIATQPTSAYVPPAREEYPEAKWNPLFPAIIIGVVVLSAIAVIVMLRSGAGTTAEENVTRTGTAPTYTSEPPAPATSSVAYAVPPQPMTAASQEEQDRNGAVRDYEKTAQQPTVPDETRSSVSESRGSLTGGLGRGDAPPPQPTLEEIRADANAHDMVFLEASPDVGHQYHEPYCPTATARMPRTRRTFATVQNYLPAWDCHHQK